MELLLTKDFREGVESSFFKVRSDTHNTRLDQNGLVIDDKKYNKLNDEYHLKGMQTAIDLSTSFNVPKDHGKEIVFETTLSSRQYFRNKEDGSIVPSCFLDRIRNIHEDPRLCSCSVYVVDDVSQLIFMFLITNQVVYGLYGRDLEVIKKGVVYDEIKTEYENKGSSFYSLFPVGRRGIVSTTSEMGPLDDYITLGFGFTHDKKVIYYLNKEPVFTITTLGYRLDDQYMVLNRGGHCQRAHLTNLSFGYGHYSFLDFQLPNNYSRTMTYIDTSSGSRTERSASGLVQIYPDEYYKELYPNTYGSYVPMKIERAFAVSKEKLRTNMSYLLFGQGMISIIRKLDIYVRNKYESPRLPVVLFNTNQIPVNDERESSDSAHCSSCGETLESDTTESGEITSIDDSSKFSHNKPCIRNPHRPPCMDSSMSEYPSDDEINTNSCYNGSSLETISDSSFSRPHMMCWKCNTKCMSKCCGGRCGSRHCITISKKSRRFKGISIEDSHSISSEPTIEGKKVKFIPSLDRYK